MNNTTEKTYKPGEYPRFEVGFFEVKNHLLVPTTKVFKQKLEFNLLEADDESIIEHNDGKVNIFKTIKQLQDAVKKAKNGCIVMFIFKKRNPKCNHLYSIDKTRLIPITNKTEIDLILSNAFENTLSAIDKIENSAKFIFFNITNIASAHVKFYDRADYKQTLRDGYEYVIRLDPCTMEDFNETLGTLYAGNIKPIENNHAGGKHAMTTEEFKLIDTMIDMLKKLKNMHSSTSGHTAQADPHKANKKREKNRRRNARRRQAKKAKKQESTNPQPKMQPPKKEKTDSLFSRSYY